MSNSLKDQLLQLGFKQAAPAREERKPRHGGKPPGPRQQQGRPHGRADAAGKRQPGRGPDAAAANAAEIDLARAYALRQRQEQSERAREEQARQAEAKARREARQKLAQLLEGKALNAADAELARHFEFGGKIRRVHVTEPQFRAINAGELGVVQLGGRYVLVEAGVARDAAALVPGALALLVDPASTEGGDEYADPRYRVPDDLVW